MIRKITFPESFTPIQNTDSVKDEEKRIALYLLSFNDYLDKAVEEYKPSIICRYAIDLCQLVNGYYQSHNIINEKDTNIAYQRVQLFKIAQDYLGRAMDLVCVPRVEVM